MRAALILFLIHTIGMLSVSTAEAQPVSKATSEWRSEEILPAYGFRAGYGHITTVGNRGILNAFYDVPMGALYLVPELVFYVADNYSYGFNVKLKGRISEGEKVNSYLDGGIQFMVWLDRAHVGLPLDYSVTYALSPGLAFETTANYTPILTLGVRPDDSIGHYSTIQNMFSILAGIRITVR